MALAGWLAPARPAGLPAVPRVAAARLAPTAGARARFAPLLPVTNSDQRYCGLAAAAVAGGPVVECGCSAPAAAPREARSGFPAAGSLAAGSERTARARLERAAQFPPRRPQAARPHPARSGATDRNPWAADPLTGSGRAVAREDGARET